RMVELLVFILLNNLWVVQSTEVHQPASFLAAQLGDQVTIECFVKRNSLHMVWYKLTTGRNIHHVAKADMFYKLVRYHDNFKDGRFNLTLKEGTSHLNVYSTKPEDAGIYYCGVLRLNYIEFGQGTLLVLNVSESVHPGDSVTLNCTINTGTCEGEHSVYWFRHDSGESPPGIISTNGDRSGQCMKSPESGSPTQSCVYNLPKRNLSLSDTGTYYCAVASCGEILFGNGTKLNVQGNSKHFPTVLVLILSNIFLSLVTFLFLCMLCNTRRGDHRGIFNCVHFFTYLHAMHILKTQNEFYEDSVLHGLAELIYTPRMECLYVPSLVLYCFCKLLYLQSKFFVLINY
uniref:Ig-like domain-containing protein n=1 Tax=Esox lucius TaxID=8010 RepID=A0A3P8Z316_ESOLU